MTEQQLGLRALRAASGQGAIVFVHGVNSSTSECWRGAGGIFWPWLIGNEAEFSDLGVYMFDYETGFLSRGYTPDDAADSLHAWLKAEGLMRSDPLIFVCHSMGGLIVRRFLVRRVGDFLNCRIGLFLVASPSLGSRWATLLTPLIRHMKNAQGEVLRSIHDNAWLKSLDRDFKDMKEEGRLALRGKELTEARFSSKWSLLDLPNIVSSLSAERYFGQPLKIPRSDHSSIAKPVDADSLQHRALIEFLREMVEFARAATARSIVGMRSEEWFRRIKEHLQDCGYARIYLHSFDHPDEFREPHIAILRGIIETIRDRLKEGADIEIISYATGGKQSGASWLAEQLNDEAKVKRHIRFSKTQKVSNATSMYLFDDKTVIYNIKPPGGDRVYHVDTYTNSIVHELMKLGFEQLFLEEA